MNRRNAISQAAVTLLAVATTTAMAQDHAHHHHAPQGGKYQALAESSSDCVLKGQACLAHCLVLLADGNQEMARCAQLVSQLLAVCGALGNLAQQQSTLVPAMAKIAREACEVCEKECRKHENKHAECKACAEGCANCIQQCKALAA